MLSKQTLQRLLTGGHLSQMFRVFCGYLGSRRKGSPSSRSQQTLFVVGICMFSQMSSQGRAKKESWSRILIKNKTPEGEKKNKLENVSSGKCHLLLINADSQQWEMHTARKCPCSLECGPVAAVWEQRCPVTTQCYRQRRTEGQVPVLVSGHASSDLASPCWPLFCYQ